MARFIEMYVRKPIKAISLFEQQLDEQGEKRLRLLPLQASYFADQLIFRLGDFERRIARREDPDLSEEADEPT
ncbi:MAG: hypothetical protein Q7S97_10005, partial [Polaromonas sp.]|nr:hypothetical protein [Polaromonas sp.]